MFDSHAHLNDEQFESDLAEVIVRAKEWGVERIINVGFDIPSSQKAVELAEIYPQMYAVIGIHPHEAKLWDESADETLRTLATHKKVVAIGETGLDYYYDHSPREQQQTIFRQHFLLAQKLNLPLVIHSRDATADTLAIVREFTDVSCLLHCFSGSVETAKQYLEMGDYLSFAGPITFKNASRLQEVVRAVPLDRILIETDCPYLAPVPKRGKRNEPANVRYVAEKLAELRDVNLDTLLAATRENTIRFFKF